MIQRGRLLTKFRRTTSSGSYYPEIDGLRFIAIALVIFYHLTERSLRSFHLEGGHDASATAILKFFTMGDVGVHLFFAISGYIISKPFLDRFALHSSRSFSVRGYYLRRITRLEPPYLLVMTGIFLFLTITGYQTAIAKNFNEAAIPLWQSYLASLPYLHGLVFGSQPKLNPPAWSLELEIRFYIIAPLIMATYFSIRQFVAARLFLILALACIAISQSFLFSGYFENNQFSLYSYIQYFMIGILICDIHLRQDCRPPATKANTIAIDVCAVIALVIFARSHHLFGGYILRELIKLGTIFLIFAGAFHGHYFKRFLQNGFISAAGGMCYTIYLIHMPIMQVLVEKLGTLINTENFVTFLVIQTVVTIPIVLASSAAFFVLVEKPCMQRNWTQRLWLEARARLPIPRKSNPEPEQSAD